MTKHWIREDMISNKSNLNKLITNADANSRLCWLYMENQKYYISDLETKLLASLNKNKLSIKLINNSNLGIRISLKKYLYSSMVNLESKKYVFMFINELEVKSDNFIDLKKLIPNPSLITNGDNLIIHAEMNKIKINGLKDDQITKKDSENDLSNLINSMTPASSLKNCTLDIIEDNLDSNRSDEVILNLDDAFNKNSEYEFVVSNQNNITEDKTSLDLASDNSENNNIMKSSHVDSNHNSNNLLDNNSISEIPNTRSTSSIKIVTLSKFKQQELENCDEISADLNDLNGMACARTSRCSSVDYMSDNVSVVSLNTVFKRKRKLLQSKISDQFENDSINTKDDFVNMSPRSDFMIQTKSLRRLSSSSTSTSNSSSSSSLCDSTSSLSNIQSKPSIFAPKRLMNQHFQKSFSEQKKVAKTRTIHNLFSPSSKKKLKLNNLFESKSSSLIVNNTTKQDEITEVITETTDSSNRNVLDKYKSLNIEESLKKQRRKRLLSFDPLSHVIDESSFDNQNNLESRDSGKQTNAKLIVQETLMTSKANSPYRSQSLEKNPLNNSPNNTNNDSIPAGQKPNYNHVTCTTSNLLELSKSSLTSKQESLMNFKFNIKPNDLQDYLKKSVINTTNSINN